MQSATRSPADWQAKGYDQCMECSQWFPQDSLGHGWCQSCKLEFAMDDTDDLGLVDGESVVNGPGSAVVNGSGETPINGLDVPADSFQASVAQRGPDPMGVPARGRRLESHQKAQQQRRESREAGRMTRVDLAIASSSAKMRW